MILLIPTLGCLPSHEPNIVLVTLDTTRADHCSAYGYDRNTTPSLSVLARDGTLFRDAYAPMATTAPSHATMFVSLYPRVHGVVKNGLPLDGSAVTLAEVLQDAGYRTAAFVSSYPVNQRFGFAQGFDLYDDEFGASQLDSRGLVWEGQEVVGAFDREAVDTTDRAISWLRTTARTPGPWFTWIHYFDPHSPYEPESAFASEWADQEPAHGVPEQLWETIRLYDAEIREADAAIGYVLETLEAMGVADRTLVVVAGDHGEGLLQHGHMEHGLHIYEEAVRVPFVMRWPARIPRGMAIVEPVELIDLMPTILSLAGVRYAQSDLAGRDLSPAFRGSRLDPEHPVFLQRRLYRKHMIGSSLVSGQKYGIRIGHWKLIEAPDENTSELYELARDPGETSNRAEQFPGRLEILRAALDRILAEHPPKHRAEEDMLSDHDRLILETLGYIE
jgi:arylsulfatase A-like enzyme